jgi:SAM-dependent methyltransferase
MAREVKHGMMTDGHLGGYVVGGDRATYYPGLWDWLVDTWEVRSVIDIGCGEGHALRYFRDQGCRVIGVDGIEQDDRDVVTHDYATGPWSIYDEDGATTSLDGLAEFDLVWSCEFVEHVEERYVPNFLATFACARYVLMTHGEPGQPGWHHVNNQPADYWKGALAAVGYQFDETLTAQARGFASMNTDPYNHFRRSGLAFRRYE